MIADDFSFVIDQEFREVPRYVTSFERAIISEELVNWVSILPVHFDLREHWEIDVVFFLDMFLHLGIRPWLFISKLIAWESKDIKSLAAKLLMELYHFIVVFVRISQRCYVDNHYAFLPVCESL